MTRPESVDQPVNGGSGRSSILPTESVEPTSASGSAASLEDGGRARHRDRLPVGHGVGHNKGGPLTIRDCARILAEQWRIVVASVAVALIAAGAIWFVTPPKYTAKLTMHVIGEVDERTDYYQGTLLALQRVTSYVELVNSTQVSRDIVDDLGLAATPGEVAGRITASSAPDSVLIDVEITGESPGDAVTLAESLAHEFPRVVDDLETPADEVGPSPVAVRILLPIEVPDSPSSTGLPVSLLLGFVAGIAVGAGAALVRHSLDTSVKSLDELGDAAQAPNIGVLAYDAKAPERPLTLHVDPQSPRAEAFRQLRTNLQSVNADEFRKVMVVTSSVEGEGRTTTLCNLAIALAATQSRVLVIESDLRHPAVVELLGLDRSVGLTSILAGQVTVGQAIQRGPGGEFDVIASGPLPPNPSEVLASKQMSALLVKLRESYDVILLDSPPLLPVTDAAVLAMAADGAVLLCRFKKTTRDQVRAAARALDAVSASLVGTVLTMGPNANVRVMYKANGRYSSAARVTPFESPTVPAAVGAPRSPSFPDVAPGRSGPPSPRPRTALDAPLEQPVAD